MHPEGARFVTWGKDAAAAHAPAAAAASPPQRAAGRGAAALAAGSAISLVAFLRAFQGGVLTAGGSPAFWTPYRIGETAGTGLVVVLAGCLIAWGWRRIRISGVEAPSVILSRRRESVFVACALVAIAGGGLATARLRAAQPAAWSGAAGAELRAGFINGCSQASAGHVDCTCVFARLSATPPYDTPAGFAALDAPIRRAERTGDLGAAPSAYARAVSSCLPRSP